MKPSISKSNPGCFSTLDFTPFQPHVIRGGPISNLTRGVSRRMRMFEAEKLLKRTNCSQDSSFSRPFSYCNRIYLVSLAATAPSHLGRGAVEDALDAQK